MLLYDRVLERCYRYARRAGWEGLTERERLFGGALRRASVYELTGCAVLHSDWERDRDRAIPKRPPAPDVWAEWAYTESGPAGVHDWVIGCLIEECPRDLIAAQIAPILDSPARAEMEERLADTGVVAFDSPARAEMKERLADTGPAYLVRSFNLLVRHQPASGQPRTAIPLLEPTVDLALNVVTMADDGSLCRLDRLLPRIPAPGAAAWAQLHQENGMFGMTLGAAFYPDRFNPFLRPWPPFMAFALLHCKNVETQEHAPSEWEQRRVKKSGNPPRVTYKTLRIRVPQAAQARGLYSEADGHDGPCVRLHLCRGHFRHLHSEKFTHKRGEMVWVPQHLRGSAELGSVHKTYSLTAEGQS